MYITFIPLSFCRIKMPKTIYLYIFDACHFSIEIPCWVLCRQKYVLVMEISNIKTVCCQDHKGTNHYTKNDKSTKYM